MYGVIGPLHSANPTSIRETQNLLNKGYSPILYLVIRAPFIYNRIDLLMQF